MSSTQKTIDFLSEQISGAGHITARKMFGEYALYCDTKVVAFVCDDELFVKPTDAGRQFIGEVSEKPAYPGSKMYFWISGEQWDDSEWLTQLIKTTADSLPLPKKNRF
jgi:TfoX/Sxy family transcriptional regulator of competence genes